MSVAARRIEPARQTTREMDVACLAFFAERAVVAIERGFDREAIEILGAVERIAGELREGLSAARRG